MSDPERDEDDRLADRLIELADLIRNSRHLQGYADDLLEAAAFINRFKKGD